MSGTAPISGGFTATAVAWGQIVASVVVICTALSGVGIYMTGGFKPASQVLTDNLTTKVDEIQNSVKGIQGQLEAMPRPSDFLSHERHLSAIDSQVTLLNDRITRDEIANTRTDTLLERIIQSMPGARR